MHPAFLPCAALATLMAVIATPRDVVHSLRVEDPAPTVEVIILTKAEVEEVYQAGAKAALEQLDTQGCMRGRM